MRPPSRSGSAAAADAAEGEPPAAARRRVEPVDGKGRAAARLGERTDQGWTLERLLGIGGVAAVYVARGPDGSHAAVKILHAALASRPALRERFTREAWVANHIDHRGVVRLIGTDTYRGVPVLRFELVEGESLGARVARAGPLGVLEAVEMADGVLDVLAAAHDLGVLHRDVKPDNVLFGADGRVRLLDFGLARLVEWGGDDAITSASDLLGTPAFMPPEQARGEWESVDARSDLWAVGATLWYALTASAPHPGLRDVDTLVRAASEAVPPLRTRAPAVPDVVARCVDCALAFDPVRRPATARQMQAELRAALRELSGRI